MKTIELGTSGIQVTPVCLGTWNMAGEVGWGPDDDKQSIGIIRRALDDGCNFVDTATGYGRGKAERVLGEAIRGRRDDVVVATKMMHCPPERVGPTIEESLERLGTDHVDLYICHWPRPSLALEPFFEEMVRQRDAGKIRAIGVSNFDADQMRTAAEFGVVSLQPPLSVLWRIPDDTVACCRGAGVALTPYSPLAQGLLTGRYTRVQAEITGVRKSNQLFSDEVFPHSLAVARKVDAIADRLGCTSSQVALAWLLRTPGVTSVIVGASSVEQWCDNAAALGVTLPDEDYRDLDEAGRGVWDMLGPDETMWGWKPK